MTELELTRGRYLGIWLAFVVHAIAWGILIVISITLTTAVLIHWLPIRVALFLELMMQLAGMLLLSYLALRGVLRANFEEFRICLIAKV